jgi:outer membrane protein assembly factor BamE
MPRASHVVLALLFAPLLTGCGLPRALGIAPYKIEVQQGNFISQEMTAQLKEGMSKDQVRQIMGTPLLIDIFHAERWDYVYSRQTSDGKREKRRMAIFFQDGKLARVDGDAMPPLPTSAAGR